MAAIVLPQRESAGDRFNRGLGAIAGVVGQLKDQQTAAAQEARTAETHEATIEGKGISNEAAQLELDQAREDIVIKGHQDEFDKQNLIAQESGIPYKPSFQDFTPEKARAFSDWQVGQMAKDVTLTEGSMKLHKAQASEQFAGIQKEWQGAVAAMSGEVKDYGTMLGHLEKGYEMHNDGADLVFNDDKTGYSVTTADGGKIEMKFDSTDAMFEDFTTKMSNFQGEEGQQNYFKQYIKDFEDRKKRNADGILESKYYTNARGEEVQAAWLEGADGKRSLKIRMWGPNGEDMGIITEEAFLAGRFKSVGQRKGEADIGKVKAEAAKARKVGSAETRKGWSPERKLAADLAETIKAFDGNVDKAMRMVQKAKNAKNLLAAQKIATDQLFLEPNTPEYDAFMKAVTTSIPKQKPKTIGFQGSGGDVDAAESAAKTKIGTAAKTKTGTPPKDYPDAKQAPDGKWYVKKDGDYFRVKP